MILSQSARFPTQIVLERIKSGEQIADIPGYILGYDLRAFFERSSEQLRTEVKSVLSKLLSAEGS